MNIHVANLSSQVTEEDLRQSFKAFGEITSATIMKNKYSGISRGFGFVEMPSQSEGKAAIAGLNNKELKGLRLIVSEARPRLEDRRGGRQRPP